MVGEVKGIEMMGVLIAGRGARERGDRRLKVKVDSKRCGPQNKEALTQTCEPQAKNSEEKNKSERPRNKERDGQGLWSPGR